MVLQTYLKSWKLSSLFWTSFLVESLTFTLLTLLFIGFGKLLELKAYAISGGRSVEELKTALLSGTVQSNQAFLQDIQIFTFLLIVGSILTISIAILVFSYAQYSIWNALLNRKHRHYWKWNFLTLVTLLLGAVYVLFFIIIRLILNLLLSTLPSDAFTLITNVLSLLFVFAFLTFLFLIYYSFTQKYKVWESIGDAFHLIKTNWSSLWKFYLLTVLTTIIVSMSVSFLVRFLPFHQEWVSTSISLGIFLLLLSWMRLYLLKTIHHGTQ